MIKKVITNLNFPKLPKLTESDLSDVDQFAKKSSFKKGDIIFRQDDTLRDIYFIQSGLVALKFISNNGEEYTKAFLPAPNICFSTFSLFTKGRTHFSAEALTDVVAYSINYDFFEEKFKNSHNWSEWGRVVYMNLFLKKEKREVEFLELDASQRYQKFLNEYNSLAESIKLADVASYLGITAVQLSRIRKSLNKC